MFFKTYMLPIGEICHMGDEMGQRFHSAELGSDNFFFSG